jgi:hypothetical protein
MKVLALLPLLLTISCNDQIGARTVASNTVDNPTNTNSPVPSPDIPVPNKLNSRCQSTSRCFFSRMPIYQQNYSGLESYIGNKIGVANYQDAGICAPTSAAMMLRAVVDEKDARTRLNNTFLENLPYKSWYETVYQVGVDAGTDFRNGGTSTANIYYALRDYFYYTAAYKDFDLAHLGSGTDLSQYSNSDVINLIKTNKPAFFIGTSARLKRSGYVDGVLRNWHERDDRAHALVIKGFDGDRLHLQDPWGMDHFARIQNENFASYSRGAVESNVVFTSFGSSSGTFMGTYGATNKIVLDEVISLHLD